MLEKAEESWDDSAESVAVAAMLDNSELRDADKLERTAETAAVTDEETREVCVEPILLASDTIDDSADEIACEACDTAEDTRLEIGSELEPVDDVATTDEGLDPVATVVTGAEIPEAAVDAMMTELPEGLSEEPATVVLDKDAPVNTIIGDVDEEGDCLIPEKLDEGTEPVAERMKLDAVLVTTEATPVLRTMLVGWKIPLLPTLDSVETVVPETLSDAELIDEETEVAITLPPAMVDPVKAVVPGTLADLELNNEEAGVTTVLLPIMVERPIMMPPLELFEVGPEVVALATDCVTGTGKTVTIVGCTVTARVPVLELTTGNAVLGAVGCTIGIELLPPVPAETADAEREKATVPSEEEPAVAVAWMIEDGKPPVELAPATEEIGKVVASLKLPDDVLVRRLNGMVRCLMLDGSWPVDLMLPLGTLRAALEELDVGVVGWMMLDGTPPVDPILALETIVRASLRGKLEDTVGRTMLDGSSPVDPIRTLDAVD
ncbi:hypothetical protein LTR66_004469 [Elasticomyces elasticus]|nr:hypothetical protein LTR66_004469 [Elasticomyces elasticus]